MKVLKNITIIVLLSYFFLNLFSEKISNSLVGKGELINLDKIITKERIKPFFIEKERGSHFSKNDAARIKTKKANYVTVENIESTINLSPLLSLASRKEDFVLCSADNVMDCELCESEMDHDCFKIKSAVFYKSITRIFMDYNSDIRDKRDFEDALFIYYRTIQKIRNGDTSAFSERENEILSNVEREVNALNSEIGYDVLTAKIKQFSSGYRCITYIKKCPSFGILRKISDKEYEQVLNVDANNN